MRTKALLLGALPHPVEGEWVPIYEGGLWRCRVESMPALEIGNGLRVDVELSNGSVIPSPIGAVLCGHRARFVIENKQAVDVISAFLEEVFE